LALLAASAVNDVEVAAAVDGGHGELFVQQFGSDLRPTSAILNLSPADAAQIVSTDLVAGPGARKLVEARGHGEAREAWPSAAQALRLPESLRSLDPKPIYARAPDARVRTAA